MARLAAAKTTRRAREIRSADRGGRVRVYGCKLDCLLLSLGASILPIILLIS